MKIKYKNKEIEPYESFYWDASERFFQGQLGGGISRCVKTTSSLAVLVPYEKDKGDIRTVKEQRQEGESGQKDA